MKIAVIYNEYFSSPQYTESVDLYLKGLKNGGLDAFKISSAKLIGKTDFDFQAAVFLDKDIALAYIMEEKGVRIFNSADAIRICDSKILTYVKLMNSDIPMPKTIILPFKFSNMEYENFEFLNIATSYPVIVKEEFGSLGQQIHLAYNKEEIIQLIKKSSSRLLLQEYIEARGTDIRVFVVNKKALCAMKRSNSNDFRSNCASGGIAENYPLDDTLCKIAEKTAEELQLDFCGVDIIKSDKGYYLIEVNSNPLINNLSKVCGIDPGFEIGKMVKTD